MIVNLLLGFILPWIFGIGLYVRNRTVLLVTAPFASVLAYTINDVLFNLNFDRFVPTNIASDLTTNVGKFRIISCSWKLFNLLHSSGKAAAVCTDFSLYRYDHRRGIWRLTFRTGNLRQRMEYRVDFPVLSDSVFLLLPVLP